MDALVHVRLRMVGFVMGQHGMPMKVSDLYVSKAVEMGKSFQVMESSVMTAIKLMVMVAPALAK